MVVIEAKAGEIQAGEERAGADYEVLEVSASLTTSATVTATADRITAFTSSLVSSGTISAVEALILGSQTEILDAKSGSVQAGDIQAGAEGDDRGLYGTSSLSANTTLLFNNVTSSLSASGTLAGRSIRVQPNASRLTATGTLTGASPTLLYNPESALTSDGTITGDIEFVTDVKETIEKTVVKDSPVAVTATYDKTTEATVIVEADAITLGNP